MNLCFSCWEYLPLRAQICFSHFLRSTHHTLSHLETRSQLSLFAYQQYWNVAFLYDTCGCYRHSMLIHLILDIHLSICPQIESHYLYRHLDHSYSYFKTTHCTCIIFIYCYDPLLKYILSPYHIPFDHLTILSRMTTQKILHHAGSHHYHELCNNSFMDCHWSLLILSAFHIYSHSFFSPNHEEIC